jgi:hypothetical protein
MKGKMKSATKFNRLKDSILATFAEQHPASNIVSFFKIKMDIEAEIAMGYDENGNERLYGGDSKQQVMAQSVFQVLRIANKPVLLRDLEHFAAVTWPNWSLNPTKNAFYTAISMLYSTNLIDYTFKDVDSRPTDVIQLFVKED